jgi:hypothetical protein
MDVRQYGPALFPTLKQMRTILDEEGLVPIHTRRPASANEAGASSLGSGDGGGPSGR